MIGLPPVEAGAVQDTDDVVSAAAAATAVGAPGGPVGVTDPVLTLGPVPTPFSAATVKV